MGGDVTFQVVSTDYEINLLFTPNQLGSRQRRFICKKISAKYTAAIGNFEIKNFLLIYGAANVTKEEMTTLVNLIASPVIANTSNDPNAAMFESKMVILNYTIVNIAQPGKI